jgi:hypothetical protein
MEQVKIQISPKQMSKLRNGHKVRLKKPDMSGSGINLIVSPENFSIVSKAFTRNKGSEIILSPQEILANREQAPSMEGEGIFGKTFDKGVESVLGKSGKKKTYQYARDVLNPLAKAGITAGLVAGSTALGATNPALVPYLAGAVPVASYLAYDYLDNPRDYQSNAGGPKSRQAKTLAKQYAEQQALNQLNSQLGTNMGNLSRAGLEQAVQDKVSQQLTASSIQAQRNLIDRLNAGIESISTLSPEEKRLLKGTQFEYMIGSGLYSGSGLYAGKGLYAGSSRQGGAIVGTNGGFVDKMPQALQSQPSSENFQFRHTLPIAFQQLKK